MNRVIVQVPMSPELKSKAEAAAGRMGFSSLQEMIRVFVAQLACRAITIEVKYNEKMFSHGRDIDSKKIKTVFR